MGSTRVLAIGLDVTDAAYAPVDALAADGMLIVMESDPARVEELRRRFASAGSERRAMVIAGDPRRMLHKLSGPFDRIFCGDCDPSIRAKLETLLAPNGVLVSVVRGQTPWQQ